MRHAYIVLRVCARIVGYQVNFETERSIMRRAAVLVMLVPTMYIKSGFYNVLVVIRNIISHVNNTCFHASRISNHLFLQLEAILLF